MSPSRDLSRPDESAPARNQDWPAQAADTIVDVVGKAHQKTTGPAITAVRGLVFGVLIMLVGIMAAILLVVGLIRVMNIVFDVWLTYLILGALFTVVGAFMLRHARSTSDELDSGELTGPA
jgi:hypothetical protein